MEKYNRARQATDDNMAHAHCMLGNLRYRNTFRICNTYCFSTATMVTRTRLDVTLSVHCFVFFFCFMFAGNIIFCFCDSIVLAVETKKRV